MMASEHTIETKSRLSRQIGKLREAKGFTLVETLMTLAILVILSGILAMGIPVAVRTYATLTSYSNAQLMLSTVTAELRDDLALAQYVDATPSGDSDVYNVEHYLSGDGYWESISCNAADNTIEKTVYTAVEKSELSTADKQTFSLTSKADKLLGMKFDGSIQYDKSKNMFIINNLEIYDTANNDTYISLDKYEIKAFSLDNNAMA